jgi:hypothetical protein
MRNAAAVGVFAGVAAVMGGLAWLLISAGDDPETPLDPSGKTSASSKRGGRRTPAPKPLEAPPPMVAKPVANPVGVIDVPGHPDLRVRDWKEIAAAWIDIVDHPRALVEGRGPPLDDPKTMERMQKTNERFMTAAMAPLERQEGPTGVSTEHPGFVGNLVPAVLRHKGEPLSEEQQKKLEALVLVHAPATDAADAALEKVRALNPVDRRTFALDLSLERAKVADAFFDSLYDLLTPTQAELIAPSEYRGRQGYDPISAGRFWQFGALPVPMIDLDDGARFISANIATYVGIMEREKEVRDVVGPWFAREPLDPFDRLEERGAFGRRRLAIARQRAAELVHLLMDAFDRDTERPLDPEQKAKLRDFGQIFVPFRVVKK